MAKSSYDKPTEIVGITIGMITIEKVFIETRRC